MTLVSVWIAAAKSSALEFFLQTCCDGKYEFFRLSEKKESNIFCLSSQNLIRRQQRTGLS